MNEFEDRLRALEEGRESTKELVKEAIKEWLDEQFAKFGRWSFYGICAAALAAFAYALLFVKGWTPPR